jgi:1-acyl-sn-glycerol-3-phosphate acyltransferase
VPLVPMALWGTQRLWTKGHKRHLTQRHVPISIMVGEPMLPGRRDQQEALTTELRLRMQTLLDQAQGAYPDRPADPDNGWWLPAHLGGTAPEPELPRATMPAAPTTSPELM